MNILLIGWLFNLIHITYLFVCVREDELDGFVINYGDRKEKMLILGSLVIPYISVIIWYPYDGAKALKHDVIDQIERSFILGLKRKFKISSKTGFVYCYLINEFWEYEIIENDCNYEKIGNCEDMVNRLQYIVSERPDLWVYHLETFEWLTFLKQKYKL